jgi:glycerate dehydrogenase
MKIVVLDGHTLNPGDLSWDYLAALGELTVYDRTPAAQVVQRAVEAPIVLTNKTVLSRPVLEQLPRLKYIGVLATGYNVVDMPAAAARGIVVTNVPDYGTPSVAQMVFAHLLNLTQHVAQHAQGAAAGRWSASVDFCYWDFPLIELAGLTFGVVGIGRIGRAVAALAQAFGMNLLAYDVASAQPPAGVMMVSLNELFSRSDVVSLHCPLTGETRGLVNDVRLSRMKPTAFLINTSRGPLVDSVALAAALTASRLAGAGLSSRRP